MFHCVLNTEMEEKYNKISIENLYIKNVIQKVSNSNPSKQAQA